MQVKTIGMVIVLFVVLVFASYTSAYAQVGYIDLQRLVSSSKMGQAARSNLEKSRKDKEAVVAGKLQEVNAMREALARDGDKMPANQRAAKQRELEDAAKHYQRLVADMRQAYAREDSELVSAILRDADAILKRVAQREKYTIILKDPNAVGYLDPKVDITDQVVKELDKK